MGGPCDHLIPAAILLDNPGITKEEFVRLLQNLKVDGSWNYLYFSGLEGLARILSLDINQGYRNSECLNSDWDEELDYPKQYFHREMLFHSQNRDEAKRNLDRSKVVRRKQRITRTDVMKIPHSIAYEPGWEIGDVDWYSYLREFQPASKKNSTYRAKVVEVLEQGEQYIDTDDDREVKYAKNQVLRVSFEETSEKKEKFKSIEALYEKYPYYLPERVFNFNQKEGILYPPAPWNAKYAWIQRDGRFYLDREKTFNQVPDLGLLGYTSVVMTAEAIRVGFWKILGYVGFRRYWDEFFETHPEIMPRREKSVWDAFTSGFAKSRQMSHSELLRMHMLKGLYFTEDSHSE